MKHSMFMGSVAILALCPGQAWAQDDSQAARSSEIGEIVVTAQKREQSLQDVPIAITALGEQTIADARIQNVEQISAYAPNVITLPQIGGNQLAGFSIRGVVASNSAPESDNPVAIYVDGVYVGRPAGAVFDLADIERIEVLRGPQGTLFGRNSTGGAISIITAAPAGQLSGRIEGSLSNFEGRRLRVRLDTPEWHGLSAQVNFLRNKRDGDVRNVGGGTTWDLTEATDGRAGIYRAAETLGSIDTTAVMARLRYQPDDEVRIDYKFDYTLNEGSPRATASLLPAAITEGTIDFISGLFGGSGVTGDFTGHTKRPDEINNWFTSDSHQKVTGHNLTAEWNVTGSLTIKNIAAYRRMKSDSINQLSGLGGLIDDQSGDPLLVVDIVSENDFKQYSDELQINYDTDAMNLVAGFYWFKEKLRSGGPGIPQVFFFSTVPDFVVSAPQVSDNRFVAESTAIFSQGTFHLSEQFDVTLGGRYTWDDKTARYFSGPILGDFSYNKSQFNYLATLTYRPSEEVMVYATTSTGYLSGGTVNGTPFNPEKVTNYEIGAKADLLDRRLRLNGALFYQNYRDLQFTLFPEGSAVLLNAGKAEMTGGELEVTLVPVSGLTLNGGFGYTNFQYKQLDQAVLDAFGIATVDDFTEAYRPKWTSSLGATYEFPSFSSGAQFSVAVDAQANAKYFTAISPGVRDMVVSPETWIVNGRATLSDIQIGMGSVARIQAWVKNLTDEKGFTFGGEVIPGGLVSGVFREARTYGVDVSISF